MPQRVSGFAPGRESVRLPTPKLPGSSYVVPGGGRIRSGCTEAADSIHGVSPWQARFPQACERLLTCSLDTRFNPYRVDVRLGGRLLPQTILRQGIGGQEIDFVACRCWLSANIRLSTTSPAAFFVLKSGKFLPKRCWIAHLFPIFSIHQSIPLAHV